MEAGESFLELPFRKRMNLIFNKLLLESRLANLKLPE